jgi:hypothetical protein
MPLPANLTTNEVKNSAGTEVEFLRRSTGPGAAVEYAQSGESPNAPHRLKVSHTETGSGTGLVRRSLVRVDKTVTGASGASVVISSYNVTVVPVGELSSTTEVKNVQAELMSFTASLGASTTILYDCTGNGADSLVNGTV